MCIRDSTKGSFDNLTLDLTAKTYRYLDEDELAAAEAKSKPNAARRPNG